MIFNKIKKMRLLTLPTVLCMALLLCISTIHADVTVKKGEINDKVGVSELPSGNDLSATSTIVQPPQWVLKAEQWELTRSGESLLSLPVINTVINAWLLKKQEKIEIQYPGGEEGELWVQELADWLVSLGVPSNHMVIVPGSGADDMIKFNLIK